MTAYEMRISDWSADVCSSDLVDRDQRRAEAHQIEIVALGEEIGQPEQEHPPDRIGEELAERERPGLAVAQQLEPRDLAGGIGRIALDQREFGRAEAFGLARGEIESEPGEQPDEAPHAGDDERGDRESTRLHSSN